MVAYRLIPQVKQSLDGLSFSLCFTLCPCVSFRQEQFWVKNFEKGGGPIPQPGIIWWDVGLANKAKFDGQ